MQEETAPPLERSWADHLKDLDDSQLTELANDYRWLNEENRSGDAQGEFERRREAIMKECERRGVRMPG